LRARIDSRKAVVAGSIEEMKATNVPAKWDQATPDATMRIVAIHCSDAFWGVAEMSPYPTVVSVIVEK
jgi:hypothetical protein